MFIIHTSSTFFYPSLRTSEGNKLSNKTSTSRTMKHNLQALLFSIPMSLSLVFLYCWNILPVAIAMVVHMHLEHSMTITFRIYAAGGSNSQQLHYEQQWHCCSKHYFECLLLLKSTVSSTGLPGCQWVFEPDCYDQRSGNMLAASGGQIKQKKWTHVAFYVEWQNLRPDR